MTFPRSSRSMWIPTTAAGELGLTAGPQTAFCQDFTIEVHGRGGHGARPHDTVDSIAMAAHLVCLIYQSDAAPDRRP